MSNHDHSHSANHCHTAGNFSQGAACGTQDKSCHQKANKLLKAYVTGFVASVILTLLAFVITAHHAFNLSHEGVYTALTILILLQLAVQAVFFFRLNMATDDDRWNTVIFFFSLLIMLIVVSGSLWIMYNLNYYMVS